MGAAQQDVLPFYPALVPDAGGRVKLCRRAAVAAFERAVRRAAGTHVRLARLRAAFEALCVELQPAEDEWKRKRKDNDRRRRAKRSRERTQAAEAMAAIRNGARGEVILACIKAAAEVLEVDRRAVLKNSRGTPLEARARVVAMRACVTCGVPIQTVAEAFKRTRRSVHGAIEIGRPGGEARDAEVLAAVREVVARVKGKGGAG